MRDITQRSAKEVQVNIQSGPGLPETLYEAELRCKTVSKVSRKVCASNNLFKVEYRIKRGIRLI